MKNQTSCEIHPTYQDPSKFGILMAWLISKSKFITMIYPCIYLFIYFVVWKHYINQIWVNITFYGTTKHVFLFGQHASQIMYTLFLGSKHGICNFIIFLLIYKKKNHFLVFVFVCSVCVDSKFINLQNILSL